MDQAIKNIGDILTRAKKSIDNNDVLDALALYELAVELDPNHLDALIGKVRTLLRIGDIHHAAKTCDLLRQAHEVPLVWALHEVVTTLYNTQFSATHVNIGGGPFFNFSSWINLESVPSPSNPLPTTLSGQTTIPAKDSSIQTVFSSHCFEHLDDQTVERCLVEARRVLKKDGLLVIKLPNFDDILKAWKNDDLGYFSDKNWNYEDICKTWASKEVADNIDSRASILFCGFWNQAYGNHFANPQNFGPGAYHGPAPVDTDLFKSLKKKTSPWAIAKTLGEHLKELETDITFSHQNAWSQDEFKALLTNTGFRVLSTDAQSIIADQSHIPGIESMIDISNYYLAVVSAKTS